MAQKEKEINDDLYSRQIGTFGMETMRKLVQLKVLIIGMRGLGVEIAKNIILSGPKSVTIYDEFYPTINDLSSNFYISEDDVGKRSRDQACLDKLKGLNPYVTVELLRFPPTNDFMSLFQKTLLNYNVVVYTELFNTNFLINVNKFCRDNNIKFIYALNFGLVGYIFSDFGNNHIIFDESGSTTISFNIKNITKSADQTLITIDNENGQNNFNIGDGGFITFKDIEGMTELNGKEYKIKYENYESFFIPVDSTKFHDYIKGGKAIRVPKNIQKKYFDYNQRSNIITDSLHEFLIMDEKKVGRNELLYMVLICIHDYFISHNCVLPELNNMTQAKEIEKNVKNFYDLCKKNKYDCYKKIQEYDEKLVLNVIRWCRAQISPVAAFFGGIVAHEIIKSTGKYEPIDQWLIMDFFEMVENISENADRSLKGSRYDDQIAIFGNEIQKKLNKVKFL